MNPRRLHSETMTSMFIKLRLVWVRPSVAEFRETPLDLSQETRRPRGLPRQAGDMQIHDLSQLVLGPAQGHRHCLVPGETSQSAQGPEAARVDTDGSAAEVGAGGTSEPAPPALDDDRRPDDGRPPPARDTGVETEPVAEGIDASQPEDGGHPSRLGAGLDAAQRADQQAVHGGVRIAIGGQPADALGDPRRVSQAPEIPANAFEGVHDVEVIDLHQIAAAAVEEDQLAEREELEGAAEPGSHPPSRPGDAPNLAVVAREEGDDSIALREGKAPDHDGSRLAQSHAMTS